MVGCLFWIERTKPLSANKMNMMHNKFGLFTLGHIIILMTFGAIPVQADKLIIDDRTTGDLSSNLGNKWRLISDQVMGGVSDGSLSAHSYKDKSCLRMRGDVSTDNNGGFVQIVLDLDADKSFDASANSGIELEVAGNNESYNLHVRTTDLWLPWQSYRSSFIATQDWQTIHIPFSSIEAYRTTKKFRKDKLKRISLVGIGRDFQAYLCIASVSFYTGS